MGGFGGPGLGEVFIFLIIALVALPLLPIIWIATAAIAYANNDSASSILYQMLRITGMVLGGIPFLSCLLVVEIIKLCVVTPLGLAGSFHLPRPHWSRSRGPGRGHTRSAGSAASLSPSGTTFAYSPLEGGYDIRVLVIYPGLFSAPLEGDIVTVNLLWWPSYDALSYTWADDTGDVTRSRTIRLRQSNETIPITANCEAAMRRLRRTYDPRRVWVDAICINQDDDGERNRQVSLMSRIYTSARQVVAYTGEATTRSDFLFDWLNSLDESDLNIPSAGLFDGMVVPQDTLLSLPAQQLRRLRSRWLESRSRGAVKKKVVLSEEELVDLVREYITRRWFKRIWVLQEVSLPDLHKTNIVCGAKSTSGKRALHLLSLIQNQEATSIARIFLLLRQRMRAPTRSYLLDIMIETGDRECGDPRDRIFGLLSITQAMDGRQFPKLVANYEDSQEVIFARFSAFFIQQHGAAFFFSLIKSPRRLKRLPSWAADWTMPWPNRKAVRGEAFPARSASVTNESIGAAVMYDGGATVIHLRRRRILRGYFTRDGHMDGSDVTTVEPVLSLEEGYILVELYPGLAVLLKEHVDYCTFIHVCPHALSEDGVRTLVERWSRVVVHGEGLEEQDKTMEYLGPPAGFLIY